MRNNNGFALIELIVTVAILAIVILMTVPRLDFDFNYLSKMSEEFIMDVRYVQMENMKVPDSPYEIKIQESTKTYYVRKNLQIEKSVTFKDRYSIKFNNGDVISFTCEGAPKKAGTFTITDTKTNEIKQITIVPATGRTIILE